MTTIASLLSSEAFSIPNSAFKDFPIDFSKCGHYSANFNALKLSISPQIISQSNVILDGKGATITCNDKCIHVKGPKLSKPTASKPLNKYYPSGGKEFDADTKNFKAGDDVVISWTGNSKWIDTLKMGLYWAKGLTFSWFGKVDAVKTNSITLDTPITYGLDPALGSGTISKYSNNRIKNIIIRNLIIKTNSPLPKISAIYVENAENVLIENVQIYGFDRGVKFSDYSHHCTARNCTVFESNAPAVGGNRYAYELDAGNSNLVENCKAFKSRHAYAGGGGCSGPHVFFNSSAVQSMGGATSQPHRLWGNGFLYDNIDDSNGIDFENRMDSGSGHGWSSANCIAWNSGRKITTENPPTARNWAVGMTQRGEFDKGDKKRPMGTIISEGKKVQPASLYLFQKSK